MVNAFANFAKGTGVVSMAEGKTYCALLLNEKPLSQKKLMHLLHMSRGGVSGAVKRLTETGLVQKNWQKGERCEFYQARTDVWKITSSLFLRRIHMELKLVHREMKLCLKLLSSVTLNVSGQEEPSNIRHLKNTIQKMDSLVLRALNIFDYVSGLMGSIKGVHRETTYFSEIDRRKEINL